MAEVSVCEECRKMVTLQCSLFEPFVNRCVLDYSVYKCLENGIYVSLCVCV